MNNDTVEKWFALEAFAKNAFLVVAVIGAPIGALWAFSDSLPFHQDVTVYVVSCAGNYSDKKCAKEVPVTRVTFKAIVDQQVVVHWSSEDGVPEKVTNCAVRDTDNWSCKGSAGLDGVSKMVDGKFNDGFVGASATGIGALRQVPKWYWWWVKLK
jgi:hypothetical protein